MTQRKEELVKKWKLLLFKENTQDISKKELGLPSSLTGQILWKRGNTNELYE